MDRFEDLRNKRSRIEIIMPGDVGLKRRIGCKRPSLLNKYRIHEEENEGMAGNHYPLKNKLCVGCIKNYENGNLSHNNPRYLSRAGDTTLSLSFPASLKENNIKHINRKR